jgi:predicted metal-dependent hydrolase
MTDDAIIDYVVVHELAHIKEMNHSARFWAVVEGILPDYRECKRKLKELQSRLSGEDWRD